MGGESFAFQGFSATNMMTCYIDGDNIIQTDCFGNRRVIGKSVESYNELEATTTEYYNKLVELGVIVPAKTQEDMMREMQKNMNDMASVLAALTAEMKEMKKNGYENSPVGGRENVSVGQSGTGGE